MARVKRSVHAKKKKRKYFKSAKGYRGARSRLWRTVKESVDRARCYSYKDRKNKKREFRKLWIQRINSASRILGVSYSQLISNITKSQIQIDRKSLSEMAVHDFESFKALVYKVCDINPSP